MRASAVQSEARLLLEQGRSHLNSTNEAPALGFFERALALLEPECDSTLKADVVNTLGLASYRRGSIDDAVSYFERAKALAENVGDERLIGMAEHNLGFMHFRRGRFAAAVAHLERAEAMLRENDALILPLTAHFAALAHDRLGEHDRAMEHYNRAVELLADGSNPQELAHVYANMARLHRRYGRHRAALRSFADAMSEVRAAGRRGGRQIALEALLQALRVGRLLDAVRFGVHLLSRKA